MSERAKERTSGEFYPSIWDYIECPSGSRVLLAESDRELCHFFATGLRRSGHAVFAVHNGEEALAALSAVSRGELPRPDAVVMDVHMPVHSGLDLLAAMRHAGWKTPVILMSAGVDNRVRSMAERFQVFACLTKPLSSARLSRAIDDGSREANGSRAGRLRGALEQRGASHACGPPR